MEQIKICSTDCGDREWSGNSHRRLTVEAQVVTTANITLSLPKMLHQITYNDYNYSNCSFFVYIYFLITSYSRVYSLDIL